MILEFHGFKVATLQGYTDGFNTAFRGGSVMGYALCSLGVLVLWVLLTVYRKARLQMLDSVRRSTPRFYMKLNPPEQFFAISNLLTKEIYFREHDQY